MSLERWQDAVIYFVLIDRFANGDPANDDFGQGEFDPKNDDCFHGGDLEGLRRRLPFIKAMGYDALWLTPPVRNQWINPYITTRGYHGYWAYDFTKIDPHFGTLEEYKRLVAEAHALGIRVIQDIVVNHTGNFFSVDPKGFDPRRPEANWKRVADGPDDPVLRMNDPNLTTHKTAAVYNFTPTISDFKDRKQTLTWALGDLDDVNLKSPLAVARMKEIYRYWIDEVGVDAFRVDTVYYTPEEFYESFLHDPDGIKPHAESKGVGDFFVFGEIWSYDYKAITRYVSGGKRPRLDSAIDHPLNEALTQVFFRKAPTQALGPVLRARRPNRNLWVNFLDNHDVERVSSRAGWPAVRQSLVALFTLPGIPCVTYGTEAEFTRSRQDMFDEAHCSQNSRAAKLLKELVAFRKADPVFSRGEAALERGAPACGLLAYSVRWKDERRLVVFNTAPNSVFCELSGAGYDVLLSSEGRTSVGGSCVLAPEAYLVLKEASVVASPPARARRPGVVLRSLGRKPLKGSVKIQLTARGLPNIERAWLLCDDDHDARRPLNPRARAITLDTTELGNGRHELRAVAELKSGEASASPAIELLVRNPYRLLAEAAVPETDKGGLGARIHAPGDPSYAGQLSVETVAARTSGRDLRLTARMAGVTNEWNPPNGFDHVYFSVFFDFPGRPGKKFLPKLGHAPADFEFNAGFLLYGWDTRSFGAVDSTPTAYGAPLVGDVAYDVDLRRREISFTFSNRFFDGLKNFEGVKIFLSTWDGYLGELRSIAVKREDWNFYILNAASAEGLPKIFDHALIRL